MLSGYSFAGALVLFFILGQDIVGARDVIDLEPIDDGSIINQLCHTGMGQNMIISRVSTIGKLHGYFSALPETEQAACRDFYLKPLTELKSLVDSGAENVCGFNVMEQINTFHWDYIVGGLAKRWRKASIGSIPEPLKVFFMNYAQEVTEKCKDALKDRLTAAVGSTDVAAETLYTNKFGFIVNQMSNVLQPQDKIKKHDDFLLLWDYLVDRELKKGYALEQDTDPATGEDTLMSFKVRNTENVWSIQKKCRQELRPIYRQTVLPVMRFIALGYGNDEKHAREDVASSELVKNWYAITQLCQLLVSINFYSDTGLKNDQATVMSMEEARNLPIPVESLASSETPTVETKPVHLDDILPSAATDRSKQVKSNMKSTGSVYRHVFRNMFKLAKGTLKSKFKNLFVSRKTGDNKFVLEGGEKIINAEMDKQENELLSDDEDGNNRGALARSTREAKREEKRPKKKGLILWFELLIVICIILAVVLPLTVG